MQTFKEVLVKYIESNNLSKADAAELFGVSASTMTAWTKGYQLPGKNNLPTVCSLLSIPANCITGRYTTKVNNESEFKSMLTNWMLDNDVSMRDAEVLLEVTSGGLKRWVYGNTVPKVDAIPRIAAMLSVHPLKLAHACIEFDIASGTIPNTLAYLLKLCRHAFGVSVPVDGKKTVFMFPKDRWLNWECRGNCPNTINMPDICYLLGLDDEEVMLLAHERNLNSLLESTIVSTYNNMKFYVDKHREDTEDGI